MNAAPALGVIPARLGSSRLPRKPLHPLAGRSLIEWVWRRACDTGLFEEVVVATDSGEVADVARGFGARVELTRAEHPSGTDRVAEVAGMPAYRGFDAVVNVQGDEPFVSADHLAEALRLVREQDWPLGTIAAPVGTLEAWRDPSVVKVVCAENGGALLFSRAPVPWARDAEPTPEQLAGAPYLRHIGVYAYRREALLRWVALPEGTLERIERLEQLRPLAAGIPIGVAVVEAAEGGVDTPADAERAEQRLRAHLNRTTDTILHD